MKKEILCRPFPPEAIKQREGHGGKMLSYLETHSVIERLNEGCDAWSFEVVEHSVHDREVVVVGRLIADGVTKMAFGGSSVTLTKDGEVVSLADDLKAGASDALKKCATLLGVGLELYSRRGTAAAPTDDVPGVQVSREPSRAEPMATEKQIGALTGIFRRQRRSRGEVEGLLEQRTGKHKLAELTRREASDLLTELTSANGSHP